MERAIGIGEAWAEADRNTFGEVAKRFMKDHERGWSDTRLSVVSGFVQNHCDSIRDKPVGSVTPEMIKDLLRTVEKTAPSLAKEGRGIVKQVFQSAFLDDIIPINPAADLSGVLKRHQPKSHTPLTLKLIPKFWEKMAKLSPPLPPLTAGAMELLAITAVRGNELRQAEWTWLEDDMLRIPAKVMKMRSPHLVPLSRQAIAIFDGLRKAASRGDKFIFPHSRYADSPMSEGLLYRTGLRVVDLLPTGTDFTIHGWRATFSTLAREHRLGSGEAIELALAHQRRGVAGIYDYSELVPERRKLLQKWADMILPERGRHGR